MNNPLFFDIFSQPPTSTRQVDELNMYLNEQQMLQTYSNINPWEW